MVSQFLFFYKVSIAYNSMIARVVGDNLV